MRSVGACVAGSAALVALLLTASCLEPDRNNGEPCLDGDQCKSGYCRAGVCETRPAINDTSTLPPPDAAADVTEDVTEDAAEDATEDTATEAEPDAEEDAPDDATGDAEEDAQDAADDAAQDAADDAQDATSD